MGASSRSASVNAVYPKASEDRGGLATRTIPFEGQANVTQFAFEHARLVRIAIVFDRRFASMNACAPVWTAMRRGRWVGVTRVRSGERTPVQEHLGRGDLLLDRGAALLGQLEVVGAGGWCRDQQERERGGDDQQDGTTVHGMPPMLSVISRR